MLYTMMQVCKQTNMTYQALKFYCNEGLIPNVKRDKNNRRVFDEHDIAWIESLTCLKKCGMSIQEIAYHLNFSTQSFFGKYFKQHTGTSPSRYKRKG